MSACRACGAEIRWAKTTKGKSIPLDYDSSPSGNVTLDNGVATVHGRNDDIAGQVRWTPHHATCPNWGKRR